MVWNKSSLKYAFVIYKLRVSCKSTVRSDTSFTFLSFHLCTYTKSYRWSKRETAYQHCGVSNDVLPSFFFFRRGTSLTFIQSIRPIEEKNQGSFQEITLTCSFPVRKLSKTGSLQCCKRRYVVSQFEHRSIRFQSSCFP